jgi:hypothetical protein
MKSGIKGILDEVLENAVNSSSVVGLLLNSVKLLAIETKKVAEVVTNINERLNKHEQAIQLLCELQKEKSDYVEYTSHKKSEAKSN